jgi:hypothetical protein
MQGLGVKCIWRCIDDDNSWLGVGIGGAGCFFFLECDYEPSLFFVFFVKINIKIKKI